jgi:hypothetical protein
MEGRDSSLIVVLTVTFIFSPFLSAEHELNDDVVFRCFITISWFASFSESNTFVNGRLLVGFVWLNL